MLIELNCGIILEKQLFTTKPRTDEIHNNEIQLNGVYIGGVDNKNKKGYKIYFFYTNGIALEYYISNENSIYDYGNKINQEKLLDTIKLIDSIYKGVKQAGGYRVVDDKIDVQVFEFVNYGNFEICTYKGKVLNDTTIFISSCEMKSKSNYCPDSFYLNFIHMRKPDSIHQLMSKNWYWDQ